MTAEALLVLPVGDTVGMDATADGDGGEVASMLATTAEAMSFAGDVTTVGATTLVISRSYHQTCAVSVACTTTWLASNG